MANINHAASVYKQQHRELYGTANPNINIYYTLTDAKQLLKPLAEYIAKQQYCFTQLEKVITQYDLAIVTLELDNLSKPDAANPTEIARLQLKRDTFESQLNESRKTFTDKGYEPALVRLLDSFRLDLNASDHGQLERFIETCKIATQKACEAPAQKTATVLHNSHNTPAATINESLNIT